MDYILKPAPGATAVFSMNWANDPFYTSAVALGIDIGIEGIGVWLRKGRSPIYARTFLFNTPEAAPLKGRRLLRGGRRCRQSEQHREVMLKEFCAGFDLPWTEIKDEENEDGPFKLRLRAVKSKLASKEALVVCLRHIIRHRGYDYHETDGGSFPWGDELKADVATGWAKAAYCSPEDAQEFLHDVSDCGWNDRQMAAFRNALAAAVERHKQGIEAALEKHFSQGKNNLRIPARKHNFPRSLVWEHTERICRNHAHFFGGEAQTTAALHKLKPILNYHRKKPGALAQRKVNPCPVAAHLFGGVKLKCDSNSDAHIRRFKLLEFLATRSFVREDGTRLLANASLMQWLLDEVLAEDIRAVEANKINGPKQERRKFGGFRDEFTAKYDPKGETELAGDKVSHNKDYFEQLGDLLRPKLSVLNARASLCAKSAEELFKRAVKDGYQAELIARNLKEKQFDGHSFYTLRQAAAAGFGIYAQVEFLLGRRNKKGKQAVPGILRRIFALPEVSAKLGGQKVPDYVIIETVGDMPRNLDQAKEIQDEQKKRREFKDKLFEKFGIHDQQQDSESRKRVLLFDQQGGSRGEAICPYTGESLGSDPLNPKLQIDHIFPESRGGISEMVNLVLTHENTNNHVKKERTPYEAFGGQQNTAGWQALVARVQKMGWNKQKRELVLREESTCPEWDNMTRMAQLARQLREEAARWLEIFGDDAKVRERIGTPTGYQTSVCRESWSEKLPADFYPKKDRNNLRHHLWDAAIISHIPPGKGMNLKNYGGIFLHDGNKTSGNITMRALPGLGPDLKAFEKAAQEKCLVEKKQTSKSKKSRFQQWIYGFPDENGQMWARDSLASLADKTNLLELLRDAGIDEKQLPKAHFEAWQERRQAQFFTREEAWAAVEALALPAGQGIAEAIFDEWWKDRLNGDKKKVTEKSLRALLAKARVPKAAVPDEKLSGVLVNRGDPGPLTRKDGTPIHGVSGTAKQMTPMAVIPHRNHKGETIGFKLATESFIRAEIWVTEKKCKDGKPELEYHRRLIPHPRGLENLRQRKLKCSGEWLTWERRLTDDELRELGLTKELDALVRARGKLNAAQEKAVQKWQKEKDKIAKSNTLGLAAAQAAKPVEPKVPWLSLRKLYTLLPPHAKRLTDSRGNDISRFAKGDLLRVPLTQDAEICAPEQTPYRTLWYRITALKANRQVELQLAERKQVKPLSDKDKKDGRQLSAEEEWLCKAFLKQPGSDDVIASLLRLTKSDDQPPHPAD